MIFNELHFIEKIYIVTSLVTALSSLFLGCFVYRKDTKSLVNFTYLLMSLTISLWSFSLFICHTSPDIYQAFFWNKMVHFWTIFIPITFFHFILYHLGNVKKRINILYLGYVLAIIFALFLLSDLFIVELQPKFDFRIWPVPGVIYPFFLLFFSFYVNYSLFLIFQKYRNSTGNQREQLKFIFIGMSIGFAGGSTNYAYFYNIPIPPVGNFFVFFYVVFLAYSIVKYRLMNITVAFTRAGIFITVYSIVLGIPVWLGLKLLGYGLWLLPIILMGSFATAGPFIYLYIQQKAEDALLQEQRRYQTTLRQASAGMGRVKDLKKLLNLIVYILTRVVHLEHALVYVYDQAKNQYALGAYKRRTKDLSLVQTISSKSPFIEHLIKFGVPIVYEEIKQKSQDYADESLISIEKIVAEMGGALVFPILVEKRLLAIIILGKKETGKLYTEDDLSVFSILANQAALAIENAQFYEDMKKTHEQLFQAEKMATIGTMADGLSHQINNRFHALGFISGDALDTIKRNKQEPMSDKLKEVMSDLERSLTRVQENVVQGGEVVQGILRYTRKGDAGLSSVDFDQVLKSAYEMTQFKIKTDALKIVRSYDPLTIPKIKGNFTQLQEVFFNLIDNAYDAMMQRKNEKKEDGFQAVLTIEVNRVQDFVEILFIDNGIGVKEEDVHKLFTPFFTTKLSSKKGTGLGLYVIQKIIEDNHKGTVEMFSEYGVGTQIKIRLPLAIE